MAARLTSDDDYNDDDGCVFQVCIFIGETLLFFNWALITDILMVSYSLFLVISGELQNFFGQLNGNYTENTEMIMSNHHH